jgi:hypothetical protein
VHTDKQNVSRFHKSMASRELRYSARLAGGLAVLTLATPLPAMLVRCATEYTLGFPRCVCCTREPLVRNGLVRSQFSLRGLIALVTALALLFATIRWFGWLVVPITICAILPLLLLRRARRAAKSRAAFVAGAGLVYGAGLLLIGVGAAAGGHGTHVFLWLYASPLGVFPDLATFAPPALWATMALLADLAGFRPARYAFLATLAAHYAMVLLAKEPFGDWPYFAQVWQRSPLFVCVAFALYVVGHVTVWYLFVTAWRRQQQ